MSIGPLVELVISHLPRRFRVISAAARISESNFVVNFPVLVVLNRVCPSVFMTASVLHPPEYGSFMVISVAFVGQGWLVCWIGWPLCRLFLVVSLVS